MNSPAHTASLQRCFEASCDTDEIEDITSAFESVDVQAQSTALNLGLLLSDYSMKAAAAYFKILPDVLSVLGPDELGPWVGMGIKVAQKSAGAGIRFFRQGPKVFSQIASETLRKQFLSHGLSLADADINLAVEYYLHAPTLLAGDGMSEASFTKWVAEGRALGRADYGLAVEYFRETPKLLPHLSMTLIPTWVVIAKKIALEKLLPAIHFIRTSPEIFSKMVSDDEKAQLLALVSEVAEQQCLLAAQVFEEAPTVLPLFRAKKLDAILLEKAMEIARFDGDLAATLFLNAPKVLKEMDDIAFRFPEWVDEGIALLKKGSQTAKGFFLLQGKVGRVAIDLLRGGVSLSKISRTLKLFAEALSGRRVSIKSTTALKDDRPEAEADFPTCDGETIYLPPHVGHFATDALNYEWYKVATAYQAGYLEFSTFSPLIHETADLIEKLQQRYHRKGGLSSLTSFFSLFPEPALIRQLFEISEGARIEFFLRREYPGLRQAMRRTREFDLDQRPPLSGLTPRGTVLELLLQISLSGKTKEPVPAQLQSILFDVCRFLGVVQEAPATVATSMKAAANVYQYLDEGDDTPEVPEGPMEAFEEEGTKVKGQGEQSGVLHPSPRGSIDPKRVEEAQKVKQTYTNSLIEKLKEAGVEVSSETVSSAISKSVERGEVSLDSFQESDPDEQLDRIAEQLEAAQKGSKGSAGKRTFFYDEWDCIEGDYRPLWCKVVEKDLSSAQTSEAASLLDDDQGLSHSITSAFQMLRPEGLKRIKGDREGDELDLDALLATRVEIKSGRSPSDRIYISRQKKERSVAVAFLADLSGSTQQQLPDQNKSILQVEKEALLLMARAVDAIGDSFALYGFSGRGKDAVDFFVLKDFDEPYNTTIDHRIAHIESAIQNRDGAAIRHAASKLAAQSEKIKTMVLISDGKPLDDDYRGSYATADTKMALKEAKRRGIHPYCITVDREGAEYIKGMYGDVSYMVIDQIEKLPIRLPQIYKRLTI